MTHFLIEALLDMALIIMILFCALIAKVIIEALRK